MNKKIPLQVFALIWQSLNQIMVAGWVVLALLGLLWLGKTLLASAPAGYVLEAVHLQPATTPITLGAAELGQHAGALSAAPAHLQAIYHQDLKAWTLHNISTKGAWASSQDGKTHFELRRVTLQSGDVILLGEVHLQVLLTAEQLQLSSNMPLQATWNGQHLQVAQQPNFEGCDQGWMEKLSKKLNPSWQAASFTLGGLVQCEDRLALPNVPLNAARIEKQNGQFFLYPLKTMVAVQRGQDKLYQEGAPAASICTLIVGKTQYQVREEENTQGGKDLWLTPVSHTVRHWWFEAKGTPPHHPAAIWSEGVQRISEATIALPSSMAWIAAVILGGIFAYFAWALPLWRAKFLGHDRHAGWIRLAWGMPVLVCWLGNSVLSGHLSILLGLVWLMWAWTSAVLWRTGYLCGAVGGLWLAVLLVVGLGALTQTQLAIGAETSRQLGFASKHLQFLLVVPLMVCLWALTPVDVLQKVWKRIMRSKNFHRFLLGLLGVALVAQWLGGDETGIAGVQPLELTKTALVLLLAGFVLNWQEVRDTNALSWRKKHIFWLGRFWRGLLVTLLVMAVIAGGVHDFSPILIVVGLLLAYLGRYGVRFWRWTVGLLLLGLLAGGIALFQHPEWLSWLSWLPQPERLRVWVQPWQHPDMGHQLQLALQAVHANGVNWLGTTWSGPNGGVMNIPVLQSDFILAFFLHKAGGLAGLLLLLAQWAWLGWMFTLSARLYQQVQQETARDDRLPAMFLSYSVYGLAWMQALHWLISWGNALGLLPVMGQPMTWMSSGNSHLWAVGLPSLLLTLFAGFWLAHLHKNE